MMISETEILARLALAALLGAVIGLERERKDWVAGLRTHMMVCLGSALIMIVSAYSFSDVLGEHVTLDPSRIAAQVISGIGFLGAGTILFLRQGIIRGLTTASGLWTVAAIGLATGGGMYFAASVTTALAIVILWMIQPLEKRIAGRFRRWEMQVTVTDRTAIAAIISRVFQYDNLETSFSSMDQADGNYVVTFRFKKHDKSTITQLVAGLQTDVHVKEVIWNG